MRRDFGSWKPSFHDHNAKPISGRSFRYLVDAGMSHDYPIAVECGSTMVRVGR